MDAATMRNAGYRVSLQVSDADVQRAYADAGRCYVRKIVEYTTPTSTVEAALMQITHILLLQRSAVATRSGGKDKTSPSLSEAAQPSRGDFENADRLLRQVQLTPGAAQGEPSKLVDDIAGIYYRNVYMAL